MNQFKIYFARVLLIIAMALPWAAPQALETFDRAGVITDVSYDRFTVDDVTYRIAPGATLDSDDSARRRLSDFAPGDVIYFKGKKLNGVNYVDMIVYQIQEPS